MKLKVKKLNKDAQVPKKGTSGSAGFDLYASSDLVIPAGETKSVCTGLSFEIPAGHEIQIRPRSGLTLNTKLRVHLGTIDADYRGEIRIIAENTSKGTDGIKIEKGKRIAQAVIHKLPSFSIEEVVEVSKTERNENGFGSTGE